MVAMPSSSGIMMSISTMSMVGSVPTRRIASRPLSAETMIIPWSSSTVASAKMLRMSSSTISTFLPSSTRCESYRRCTDWRSCSDIAAVPRCRKKAVASSSRSSECTSRSANALCARCQCTPIDAPGSE